MNVVPELVNIDSITMVIHLHTVAPRNKIHNGNACVFMNLSSEAVKIL